jgi:hypothetical protein
MFCIGTLVRILVNVKGIVIATLIAVAIASAAMLSPRFTRSHWMVRDNKVRVSCEGKPLEVVAYRGTDGGIYLPELGVGVLRDQTAMRCGPYTKVGLWYYSRLGEPYFHCRMMWTSFSWNGPRHHREVTQTYAEFDTETCPKLRIDF